MESEVLRLEQLKVSKMKDLVLKKKTELEEHRRRAHLISEEGYAAEFSDEVIEAGKDHILECKLVSIKMYCRPEDNGNMRTILSTFASYRSC